MKRSLLASVVLFYTSLLLTMVGTPLLLHGPGAHARHADAQVWDRFFDTKQVDQPEKLARLPLADAPAIGRVPLDKALPDAEMINKPVDKLRARIVKA